MKDEDLEKTKSLDDLNEIEEKDIDEEYDNLFRERRYSNIQEDLDADLEEQEVDENGDIIIEPDVIDDSEQVQLIVKPRESKFKNMSKSKKALFIILIILIIASIIGIVCLILFSKEEKTESVEKPEEIKDVIVMKDNYIYKNGNLIFLDDEDKEIGTYECVNKDEKLCFIAYQNNKEDEFYKTIILNDEEEEIVSRIPIYFDRFVFIYDNSSLNDGLISLYDFKTNKKTGEYQSIKNYSINDRNYIITQDKLRNYQIYELAEDGMKIVINKDYKYLGIMPDKENDYIIAKGSTGYYLLDFNGKEVSKAIGKKIFNYDENYIVTVDNDSYSLYTYNNSQKLNGYRFINLENSYIVLVDEDNNIYYRDKELNKINEEGFKLNNDSYIPQKIYTEDGVLKESIYAYQSNFTKDTITVAIQSSNGGSDSFKNLSLEEHNYNKTIKRYSYINEKLYFYNDDNKETLIGTYSCKNKNEEFKEGELLNNCHPAFDTIYEDNDMNYDKGRVSMIPIYNNQYVFVYDGTINNPSVILYDLVNKKEISIYESVNTYSSANKGILDNVNVDNLNVIAKNKNSKFGMIKISKENVIPVHDFKYNSMEMIGGKVLVSLNDKWKILYSQTSTSAEFAGKIRGFVGNIEYFKIMMNSNYYVYDSEGSKVTDESYKYVELYTSFYAAVDNDNKLMLYNYKGQEMIDEKIKLYTTNYYGDSSNAFMVAASGNKVIVEVLNNGIYESVEKDFGVKKPVIEDPVEEEPQTENTVVDENEEE